MKVSAIIMIVLFVVSGIFYYNLTVEKPVSRAVFVSRIIDGDTVETNESLKIRLKGINTPEVGYFGSDEAAGYLSGNLLNKTVILESIEKDKYGRTLGYLFLDDENINLEILKRGHGSLYYYEEDGYFDDMSEAEDFARINGLGIWKASPRNDCVNLISLDFSSDPEKLILENVCDYDIEVVIKDDATHIYKEVLMPGIFEIETSHIWNDEGDSVYVYDNEGLLEFYRY
jgi:endonuclease YncB( thermonuclease family)